jgi:micrococcal nuclease
MKRMKPSTKLILIVLVAVIVFALAISLAIYLLQNYNQNPNEENEDYNTGSVIIEIIDGDTFRMQDGEIVRLICIDAPEKGSEGYEEAVSFLETRLLYSNAVIKLEGNSSDKYGRSLRWVYVNDVLLNKEIVDYGYGSVFEYEDENCSLMN